MTNVPYTALPLATLALTAHTSPVSPRTPGMVDRDDSRQEPDGTGHENDATR